MDLDLTDLDLTAKDVGVLWVALQHMIDLYRPQGDDWSASVGQPSREDLQRARVLEGQLRAVVDQVPYLRDGAGDRRVFARVARPCPSCGRLAQRVGRETMGTWCCIADEGCGAVFRVPLVRRRGGA